MIVVSHLQQIVKHSIIYRASPSSNEAFPLELERRSSSLDPWLVNCRFRTIWEEHEECHAELQDMYSYIQYMEVAEGTVRMELELAENYGAFDRKVS